MTTAIKVNGKEHTVVSGSIEGGVMELAGKRGGGHTLVRNVKSGAWILLVGGVRQTPVRSLEFA